MRCFNCHIVCVNGLILSVKVRMVILGKAPGIAIYCFSENLMLFSPNNQILSTFHRSFPL